MSYFSKYKYFLIKHNKKLFTRYLLVTNVTVSTAFSGLSDFIEQKYEIYSGHENEWQKIRTCKLASTGIPIGIVCHYWYRFLDNRFVADNARTLLKKFLADQLIASPIIILIFFTTIGLWNNWSLIKLKRELIEKGQHMYKTEWLIWPPVLLYKTFLIF
jgi:protein Mpv17